MESVHGVDVSWLHHPQKENGGRSRALSSPAPVSKPDPNASQPKPDSLKKSQPNNGSDERAQVGSNNLTPASATELPGQPLTRSVTNDDSPSVRPRRPNLLNRASSEKLNADGSKPNSRRGSWMTSISNKFSSSQAQQGQGSPQPPQTFRPQSNSTTGTPSPQTTRDPPPLPKQSQTGQKTEPEELQPYVPQKPKESASSFFSSITRRLSSSSQTGNTGRMAEQGGGVCPRRILNVDPTRERCLVPELDDAKLKRVSFSVDVEIAAGPKYKDEVGGDPLPIDKQKKVKDKKTKERAEGEALKHPQAVKDIKEDEQQGVKSSVDDTVAGNEKIQSEVHSDNKSDDDSHDDDAKPTSHKKEKKKRSEEERKARKEKKRQKAEENGTIPLELKISESGEEKTGAAASIPAPGAAKPQDRPTTDPVRIYRRCCQLRESPILKRITEQLMAPNCTIPGDSGTVAVLNLTGSRLQLADFITLGDWLAVVPVKRVMLEDAEMTDEGLRVVLAGLLAAKKPRPTRVIHKTSNSPDHPHVERSGLVERLNLKNNPRLTKIGWKHIALFLYMCRSIKALDVSMNQFPQNLPPSAASTPVKASDRGAATTGQPIDAAEIFSKALSERLGGSRLEELGMSECGLSTAQLRKIIDGATISGVSRLGLSGNVLDDEGYGHILSYVRSGVCTALDIGSNDLRGKLDQLADAIAHTPESPLWGLSLVNCNLGTEGLRDLLSALVKLRNFRFIDLSHNKHLFENDAAGGVHLLRKFIPRMQNLKRVHLMDVGMSTRQAIAIAEVLPEGPSLAHVNILENEQLAALVAKTDENSQEEACALYASLMSAVRVSHTIICIDIEPPPQENSEIVKALAKQVVAYSLRNIERLPISEARLGTARSELTKPHEREGDEIAVPDVLMHLVGHVDGNHENHDNDEPAPDDDYIVGGNGVVKALQYCLGEMSQDTRRGSVPISGITTPSGTTTPSGITTPVDRDAEAGREIERKGKAKEMSKNLLESARKIRNRLRPALVKEAALGDELAYRRLLFLDQTLQGMIQRFEDEYPETRLGPPSSPKQPASLSSSVGTVESAPLSDLTNMASSINTLRTEASILSDVSDDELDFQSSPHRTSRHNSDVNIASRALSLEEGRIHRLGQGIRRDILNAPSSTNSPTRATFPSTPPTAPTSSFTTPQYSAASQEPRLADLARRLENLSGPELIGIMDSGGWNSVMEKIGANIGELRLMQERDPVGWEQFKESQVKARMNVGRMEEGDGAGVRRS